MHAIVTNKVFLALMLSCSLAACLPDQVDPDGQKAASGQSSSKSDYYAGALGNAALRIQNAVSENWASFSVMSTGQKLDLAALGVSGSGIKVASSLCPVSGATNSLHLTWLDGHDSTGHFSVSEVGTDVSSIMAGLKQRLSPDQVATYEGGTSLKLSNGETLALPSSCPASAIPAGAPVLVYRIEKPAAQLAATAKVEYRTLDCGAGMAGAKLEKRVVNYGADGKATEGLWLSESNNCTATNEVAADVTTLKGGASVNVGSVTQEESNKETKDLGNVLQQQLQMDCVKAEIKSSSTPKETDDHKSDYQYRYTSTAGVSNSAGGSGTGAINTCNSIVMAPVEAQSYTKVGTLDESRTIPCQGATAPGKLAIGPFTGDATYTPWAGAATLTRASDMMAAGSSSKASSSIEGKWVATGISCIRNDSVTVGCTPPATGTFTAFGDNASLVYKRSVAISGFKDKANLVPNAAVAGAWAKTGGSCRWTETGVLTKKCADGYDPVDGEQERVVTADALFAGGYTQTAWSVKTPADCVLACPWVFEGPMWYSTSPLPESSGLAVLEPGAFGSRIHIDEYVAGNDRTGVLETVLSGPLDTTGYTKGDYTTHKNCGQNTDSNEFTIHDLSRISSFELDSVDLAWEHAIIKINGHTIFVGPFPGGTKLERKIIDADTAIVDYGGFTKSCKISTADYIKYIMPTAKNLKLDVKPYLVEGKNIVEMYSLREEGAGSTHTFINFKVAIKTCGGKSF